MKTNIKLIFIFLLIIVIIGSVTMSILSNKKPKIIIQENTVPIMNEVKEPIDMCYFRLIKTDRGFFDKTWIKLSILDDKVTGEFYSIPAEKDSKIGTFEGTVGPVDKTSMSRNADVWWDSFGEGMKNKEELSIEFGDGSASAGAGDMVDRGDGVYIYKDKSKLFYNESLSQYDCVYLDEKILVEKYIQDNIKNIATNKPVLGGSWNVMSVNVDPVMKQGGVVYEDGHIQSKATFSYSYDDNTKNISIIKFKVIK
ncbi:MAG: hypothetical protein WCI91_03010 [Candidatus Nomurabacteria bacterium]